MPRAVVIACSTGGPRALSALLPALPARLGAGTSSSSTCLPGFTGSLAARLDRASRLQVREASDGDALGPTRPCSRPGAGTCASARSGASRLSDEEPWARCARGPT